MTYVHDAPESVLDTRYQFHWKILETALERTREKWGAFSVQPSARMTELRQVYELEHATGRLSVMYLSPTPEIEKSLIPIRIPVDKNLSGYFVLLIRREDQPRFDAVRTVDELRKIDCGLGRGWADVEIMKSQGFRIVTGSSYDGLFEMLIARRFAMFPRSGVEIMGEFESRRAAMSDLHIEQGLMLYYPLPMYFWFSRTPEGRRLAERAEEGMRAMIADGTYDRMFSAQFREQIKKLGLNRRRVFAINNPNLGPETPFADARLWFDPKSFE